MDVHAYLERIGYGGPVQPSTECLAELHRAHLCTVPFENLDISRGRPIVLDEELFVAKIVSQRRGGFCYELNGAFATLLRTLGFRVTYLSARVATQPGWSPEFDHMALLVELEQPWLADVGFGDCFLLPLPLQNGYEQIQAGVTYGLHLIDARWQLTRDDGSHSPTLIYDFSLEPRQLADFSGMCRYHQTSSDSPFMRGSVCSLPTPRGRITLSGDKLVETVDGACVERDVSDDEHPQLLLSLFGIDLED